MYDIVIPGNNEKELASRAKELGISELVFLKRFRSAEEVNRYAATLSALPIAARAGLLLDKKADLKLARRLKQYVSIVVVKSDGSEDFNRAIFECEDVDIATDIASSTGRDHTHYRRSGLNQVLAKLAKENKISYALNFSRLLSLQQRQRVLLLGRWMQNCRIFGKYGVPVGLYSFASDIREIRNKSDLEAFGRILC